MGTDNLKGFVESFGQLYSMQNEDNDIKAAELYRAMFRHEKDINKLDFNYADHILGYVSVGFEKAIEDYRNYLQYLKTVAPTEYPGHLKMFKEEMNRTEEEN